MVSKHRIYPVVLLLILSTTIRIFGQTYTFWEYGFDRYKRPALLNPIEVPDGVDPYTYFARKQNITNWFTRKTHLATIISETPTTGVIPILVLHKIGHEKQYSLTSGRFKRLLRYINDNGWYLISDSQYIDGDLSRVPTGLKPIVMGSDDASRGNMIYKTSGSSLTGVVKRRNGDPILDPDSMVAILEKYMKREEGRINFTFYMSFDAIPFRQLDANINPGFPYPDIPVVAEKVRYLDKNFILGIHSRSHVYAYDMGINAFADDVLAAWVLIDDYAGGIARSVTTMTYPYGLRPLTPELRTVLKNIKLHGRSLKGAFDLDNNPAPAPGLHHDVFHISRINVDNTSWSGLLPYLDSLHSVITKRYFIRETNSKMLPPTRTALGADASDGVWILVQSNPATLADSGQR